MVFVAVQLIPCFKKLRALTARLDWHEDVVFIGLLENRLQLQSTGVGELRYAPTARLELDVLSRKLL